MTKEHYLQLKKQIRVWFTVNIIIGLIAIAGGILAIISKSRHIPFLLMAMGAVGIMNRVLIVPAFNAKKKLRRNILSGRNYPLKILKYLWKICRKGFWYPLQLFWLSLWASSCSIALFRQQMQELKWSKPIARFSLFRKVQQTKNLARSLI